MKAADLPELEKRLLELSDALGGRPPTKGALRVWLDTLSECQSSDVWGVLVDWAKDHQKAPTPAEVLKKAREVAADRRERLAAADRQATEVHNPFDPASYKPDYTSANYLAFRQAVSELKARGRPSPKAWAWKLKQMEEAGEALNQAQRANWRSALKGDHKAETEDEIEARLEREAIQAEGVA